MSHLRPGRPVFDALEVRRALDASLGDDQDPPTLVSSGFEFETYQRVVATFSEPVGATIGDDITDIFYENRSTGRFLAREEYTFFNTPDGTGTSIQYLRGTPLDVLPDGNWRVEFNGALISDAAGNGLKDNYRVEFFVLAGDANRDRSVDIADFSVLAGRFNQPGTFSQGAFDYSGAVGIADFAILAGRFNRALPPLPAGPASPEAFGEPAELRPIRDLLNE